MLGFAKTKPGRITEYIKLNPNFDIYFYDCCDLIKKYV